jgi:hypothetical protein
MTHPVLTQLYRDTNHNADLGEKIGDACLGLLRTGFGRSVIVKQISNGTDRVVF